MSQLTLQLLGGFRLHDEAGREVKVTSRKGRALLAYLAVHAGESHGRDRLATLLWEDADEELARTSLRQALTALRKMLPGDLQPALIADVESIQLDPASIHSDLAAFRRGVAAGTRTGLQEAINNYRGDLLEGVDGRSGAFDEWLSRERLTLRRQAVEALQKLTHLCTLDEDLDGALTACTRLVALEPLNETAHRTVMELHAKRNAYADAIRQYRICRDALRRELDIAPEPATEALHRELLKRRRAAAVGEHSEETAGAEPIIEATSASSRERKPALRDATILVARLEGLLGLEAVLDPEESYALSMEFQSRVQRAAEEFGGYADRRVGSNVTVVFGVPVAYGNEAERAARAALMLRDLASREPWPVKSECKLQIGIAQGQVLCSADVFPLTGRPTQTAHALAARAGQAGILISEDVRHALGDRITTQPLPAPDAAETPAWVLQAIRIDAGAGKLPFVGRRPELAMILAVLDRCRSSHHGRAIVIRGEAGIGKTRLVDAVRAAAQERAVATHAAQVFDFGQSPGRRPITTLALSLLGVDPEAPAQHRADAVQRVAEATRAGVDQRIFLSDLIDAPLDDELTALERAMEAATRQRGRSLMLSQIIESAAQRKPQLLIVEDVHWADSDELARFGEIAATVANSPILFIMTTRPEGDPLSATWRARARGCPVTTVDLAPLAPDEAEELATHYPDLPADRIQACIVRAEGYPLFLDQLLRAASAGHDSLPGSVRALVLARADRLSIQDHHALQAGAVLGQRFGLQQLRYLLDLDDFDPGVLVEAALVRCDGTDVEFAHALFRDALYESTLKSRRRELHRRAAAWFADKDPALHADHLAAAESEGAAGAYIDAARLEQTALRFERALTLANKANALAREPGMLHRSSCLLGELLLQLNRTHDALTAYRESLDFAVDQTAAGHAWLGIASALRIMDRHEEALDALDRAETALGEHADAQTRARMFTLRGNLCFPLGRFDACREAHEQAHRYALLADSPLDIARALGGLGDAYYQRGHMLTAREQFTQCIAEARKHGLTGVLLANVPMLAITQTYCCEPQQAQGHFNEALELARHVGDMRGELLVHLGMSSAFMLQARIDDTYSRAQRSLELAKQVGARRFHAECLGIMASVMLLRGDRAAALKLAEEGVLLGRETGMSYCGPMLLSVVARATDAPAIRAKALAEGEELLAAGCVSHSYFEFYSNAIEVSLREGLWEDARRYALGLETYTKDEPVPWCDLLIRRGRLLADLGQRRNAKKTRNELAALRDHCVRHTLHSLVPGIDAALAC